MARSEEIGPDPRSTRLFAREAASRQQLPRDQERLGLAKPLHPDSPGQLAVVGLLIVEGERASVRKATVSRARSVSWASQVTRAEGNGATCTGPKRPGITLKQAYVRPACRSPGATGRCPSGLVRAYDPGTPTSTSARQFGGPAHRRKLDDCGH